MDPELFVPLGLLFSGMVGWVSRRNRRGKSAAARSGGTSTVGETVDHAGESLSQWAASALRGTGRFGVDTAAKIAGGVGAATSTAAGLVVDGAVTSVGSVARPVVRGAGRALSGVARGAPRGRSSRAARPVPAHPGADVEDTMAVTTARGKRVRST